MKVLHLTTHLNSGGITSYILRLVAPLKRRGIEVCVASAGGDAASLFRKAGADTFNSIVRTKSELDPRLYFAIPKLVRLIREQDIQLIHAHTRVTQVLAFWIQKITGIPVVTTCHGHFERRLGRKLIPAWGNQVVAISRPVAGMLKHKFEVPPEKIKVIWNGIAVNELIYNVKQYDSGEVKESYGFSKDDYVIGSMSRLVRDKGHEFLIRAAALLKDDFPTMRLLIVGDGKYRRELELLVKRVKMEKYVVFTGMVQDIAKPLSVMDCFVFPAYYKEGLGLSLVEAMACGIPVIATRIWAINQILEHEKTGLLIQPKSIQAIVESVKRLRSDAELRHRIRKEAKDLVFKQFSVRKMTDKMAHLYQQQLSLNHS